MEKKRLKVLHIINSMKVGGAEILVANSLAKGALPDHTENVLVYIQGESHLLDRIDPSVKIICLEYKGKTELYSMLRRLRRVIKEQNPSIIHSHLNPAGFYTNMVRPRSIPQVHTLHTMYSYDTDTRASNKFLEKHLLFRTSHVRLIFLSDLLQQDFFKSVRKVNDSFVLPNFVADEYFQPLPVKPVSKPFRLIAVGTVKPLKNYQYLLRIFEHLRDEPIELDIYGGGDHAALKQQSQEKKLAVHFKGSVKGIHQVLPGYDLFITSSTVEGYPLSVLEAMAGGIPVILSDIPALRDLAGENAHYFSLTDQAAAAKTIRLLASNKPLLDEYAQKARHFANEVGRKEKYLRKLLDVYKKVIS